MTEFAVTLRALKDYLPHLPAEVLDVGGGPGRYSIAVAKLGHRVTLLDLSEGCLQLAQKKAQETGVSLAGYLRGNAIDLHRFKDGSFDVVLLMGPLYHLLDMDGRDRAVKETHRVLRKNGDPQGPQEEWIGIRDLHYPICSSAMVGEERTRVAFAGTRAIGNRCVACT